MSIFYRKKVFSFDEFSQILLALKNNYYCNNSETTKVNYYCRIVAKLLKKEHNDVVIFTKDNKKYVSIVNLLNYNEVKSVVQNIAVSLKNDNNIDENYVAVKQLFIHTHGINGYLYDLINYFTHTDFIKSILDKDVCIFVNNNHRYRLLIPFITKIILSLRDKVSIKKQNKIISLIANAMLGASLSKNNTSTKNDNRLDIVLSGFSHGCILNTYILNNLLALECLSKKINNIYLIEEAIPCIKYVLEPFKKRYIRLKNTLAKKRKAITLILIPVDQNDKMMLKYHPIDLIYDFMQKINNDIEMKQSINTCQYCANNDSEKNKIIEKLSFDKNINNNFFKIITKMSDLNIKYCPQKNNMWH